MAEVPRLPNDRQRLAIIGDTGSGKTVAAIWHLSKRNLSARPWMVWDWKGDEHINAIERAEHVGLTFVPKPKDRGIFIVHPRSNDGDAVEEQMWKVYEKGNTGIYVDEGFMIVGNEAAETIMMQGRSMGLPMIVLAQRPVDISRYLWSEAEFFQYFPAGDERDMETVSSFVRGLRDKSDHLPEFHSYYYDKKRRKIYTFKPVPPAEESIAVIDEQLRPRRKLI